MKVKPLIGIFAVISLELLCFLIVDFVAENGRETTIPRRTDLIKTNNSTITDVKLGQNDNYTVLIWTPFHSQKRWSRKSVRNPFNNTFCNYDQCHLTYDKTRYKSADVILFHCRNVVGGWPKVKLNNQMYGLLCMESPNYSTVVGYENKIDLMISYRRDSDIFTPYHKIIKKQNSDKGTANAKPTIPLRMRSRDVLWPVSHCSTSSRRELYVNELKKYIDVDIYGRCGNYTCPQSDKKCETLFSSQYKFLLSFENSYCQDYVTEKFFKAYWLELIPIVFGNVDYRKYYPRHSFIDIRDYKSPKHLAKYLNYLRKNEAAFNSYFRWKLTYVAPRDNWFDILYCDLCQLLMNKTAKNTHPELETWWKNGKCPKDIILKLLNQSSV